MKPEEQRIELAKLHRIPTEIACPSCHGDWRTHSCIQCDAFGTIPAILPDYLNDLNAMHEVEKVLRNQDWEAFSNVYIRKYLDVGLVDAVTATASQRAEALLRTIGKWKD